MQPLLPWKSNTYHIFWVCVCSLRHPSRNAHAPYCHLWPVWLYQISPRYLIKDTIFEKKLLNIKCVSIFPTTYVWNIYHSRKKWARYDQNYILCWSSRKVSFILVRFQLNLAIFDRLSKYIPKWNIKKKSVRWKPSCCIQTDRHDEANSRLSQFPNAPGAQVT